MSLKVTTDAFLAEVLADDPSYPNGTVFIDVESSEYVRAIADAIYERRSFAVVFPTGRQQLYTPAGNIWQRAVARIAWPVTYKALCSEIQAMQTSANRPRKRPDKDVPKRLSRGHYALATKARRLAA